VENGERWYLDLRRSDFALGFETHRNIRASNIFFNSKDVENGNAKLYKKAMSHSFFWARDKEREDFIS
jgi:hypothetical protein